MVKKFRFIITIVFMVSAVIWGCNISKAEAAEIRGDWKIYDDMDENLSYSSKVASVPNGESENYLGTYHGFVKGDIGETCKFNFTGDKLAVRGCTCYQYTGCILIQIDGVDYYRSARTDSTYYNCVIFSEEGLGEGEHSAIIKSVQPSPNPYWLDFRIDAVQVGVNDYLLPFHSPEDKSILKVEKEVSRVSLNNEVNLDLTLNNINDALLEEVEISYDPSKLKYVSETKGENLKVFKCKVNSGKINAVLKNLGGNIIGENNINRKVLLNLKFKSLQPGCTFVTVSKGNISNGKNKIKELSGTELGQAVVLIK